MNLLNTKKIILELFDIFREGTLKGVIIYPLFKLRFKNLEFSIEIQLKIVKQFL